MSIRASVPTARDTDRVSITKRFVDVVYAEREAGRVIQKSKKEREEMLEKHRWLGQVWGQMKRTERKAGAKRRHGQEEMDTMESTPAKHLRKSHSLELEKSLKSIRENVLLKKKIKAQTVKIAIGLSRKLGIETPSEIKEAMKNHLVEDSAGLSIDDIL